MNNIWSDNIQGIDTLFLSRQLRFDDFFFGKYESLFSLDRKEKIRILEIGCGPGSMAASLHRWYPNAEIIAIDRDSNFINYATANVSGVQFMEGDATALPFEEDTFDVTISYTVCEHVEPSVFYAEQKRVLKNNGICLVLSARTGFKDNSKCLDATEEEKKYLGEIFTKVKRVLVKYDVGKYNMTESELSTVMEKNGFVNVSTGYVVIDLTPDNPCYSLGMAERMINAQRYADIEAFKSLQDEERTKVTDIINQKYDSRIGLYRKGEKQWDTSTSVTLILRGINHKII